MTFTVIPDDPAESVRLRARLRLQAGADIHLGPGRVDLLEGIAHTGSIAEAGRRLGMSYQRAWSLVKAMNEAFVSPLVEKQRGGHAGGGAALTELGTEVLQAYRRAEQAAERAAAPHLRVALTALAPVDNSRQ
jgi:molybdate transport system regulatory protein